MKKTLFTALFGMVFLGFSSSIMAICPDCPEGCCYQNICYFDVANANKAKDMQDRCVYFDTVPDANKAKDMLRNYQK